MLNVNVGVGLNIKMIAMSKTKNEKAKAIAQQILELKMLGNTVATKKTIQTLQKELDELTK